MAKFVLFIAFAMAILYAVLTLSGCSVFPFLGGSDPVKVPIDTASGHLPDTTITPVPDTTITHVPDSIAHHTPDTLSPVQPPPPNKPPTARIGGDSVVYQQAAYTKLSAKIVKGDSIIAYWWTEQSGSPYVRMEQPDSLETGVWISKKGRYQFTFCVVNKREQWDTTSTFITVN